MNGPCHGLIGAVQDRRGRKLLIERAKGMDSRDVDRFCRDQFLQRFERRVAALLLDINRRCPQMLRPRKTPKLNRDAKIGIVAASTDDHGGQRRISQHLCELGIGEQRWAGIAGDEAQPGNLCEPRRCCQKRGFRKLRVLVGEDKPEARRTIAQQPAVDGRRGAVPADHDNRGRPVGRAKLRQQAAGQTLGDVVERIEQAIFDPAVARLMKRRVHNGGHLGTVDRDHKGKSGHVRRAFMQHDAPDRFAGADIFGAPITGDNNASCPFQVGAHIGFRRQRGSVKDDCAE